MGRVEGKAVLAVGAGGGIGGAGAEGGEKPNPHGLKPAEGQGDEKQTPQDPNAQPGSAADKRFQKKAGSLQLEDLKKGFTVKVTTDKDGKVATRIEAKKSSKDS